MFFSRVFSFFIAFGAVGLVIPNFSTVAKELRVVELNCVLFGRMRIKEAAPNEDDLRNPLADFLVLTLPNGIKVNLVRSTGANVRNWTSPSTGITFSQAPTWSKEKITLNRDIYAYRKGSYSCDSKW